MPPRNSDDPADEYERVSASETSDTESSSDEESSSDDESTDNENKTNYENNTSLKNARELALMAEEKWLYEMLKNTREQRNALKVEMLYYQGLKAALFAQHAAEFGETEAEHVIQPTLVNDLDLTPIPKRAYPVLSPSLDHGFTPNGPRSAKHENLLNRLKRFGEKQAEIPSNIDDFDIYEEQCNEEELRNLAVEFEKSEKWDNNGLDYESDEEEEEEEWSRVNIDMSMLVGHNDGD